MFHAGSSVFQVTTMKITTLLFFTSALLLASCSQSVDPPDTALPDPSIKDNKIEISLDADHVVTDRDITITMRCTPLVSGKGHFELESSGQFAESMVILNSPVVDTLTGADINHGSSFITIPAEFVANEPFEQRWRVRLQSNHPSDIYKFGAGVGIDSIYIADSNRLYWLHSDVVKNSTKRKKGYQSGALSGYIHLSP
jgi:hypothetical protein